MLLKFSYILFFTIILISCSSTRKIYYNKFDGMSRVKDGDTLKIDWDFENAHYVRIKDIPQNFSAIDSLTFVPMKKTNLEFSAINIEDTLNVTWRVYVDDNEKKGTVFKNTGVLEKDSLTYPISYQESKYFSGVLQNPKNLIPENIKIMGYDSFNKNLISYNVLLLDQFGNYIPGMENDNLFVWKIKNSCGEYNDEISTDQYEEKPLSDEKVALKILVDNSKAGEYNQNLLYEIKNGLTNMRQNTLASLGVFNQNYEELIPLTDVKDYINSKYYYQTNDGLSAIYKNIYRSIAEVQFTKNVQKNAVIVLTYSPNNAATIYNAKDVVAFARESKVPIFIIGIGSAVDTYSMKYLSFGTGGRYYSLDNYDFNDISKIIDEIRFSLSSHYTINVPKPIAQDCEFYTLKLKLNFNDRVLEAEGNYVNNPSWGGNSQQSIAIFDYKNTRVNDQYVSLISSMARVLKDNPQYSIELIGHSSIEDGKEENNVRISKERADSVKSLFLSFGVADYQLKTTGLGSSKPIYYLPSTEWQQYYNRRVEVSWVKPGDLPYEIIAQEYWTEDEARIEANKWQSKGYKAYYERYLVNNRPSYKIKLWGFGSKEQARQEAKKLQASYKFEFHVE